MLVKNSNLLKLLKFSSFLSLVFLMTHCSQSCEPPFPPQSHIEKFRILAIRAEPPEVAPGETTKLSFLAMLPNGGIKAGTFPSFPQCLKEKDVTNAFWIACLPALGAYKKGGMSFCTDFPVNVSDGGSQVDAGMEENPFSKVKACSVIQEHKGDKGQLCLPIPPCGQRIHWKIPDCFLDSLSHEAQVVGEDALILLMTTFEKQRQISYKRVHVSIRPQNQQNRNPKILALSFEGKEVKSCRSGVLQDCSIQEVHSKKGIEISALIDPKSFDLLPPSKKSQQLDKKEDIQIFWYATAGEFDRTSTLIPGDNPEKRSAWPKWYPNDYKGVSLKSGSIAHIIAIARDQRGGFDWRIAILKFKP